MKNPRLSIEYSKLINLTEQSPFIKIQAISLQPGWPPEKYIVTYICKGIVNITKDNEPIYGEFHQVEINIAKDFPLKEPKLRWLTPIWHPNIEHYEPYQVCTNNLQSWWSGKSLTNLVIEMGELIQYKRYHAAWTPPFPLNREVAKWVREYAEPKGIVALNKPIDSQPLLFQTHIDFGHISKV